ANHFISISTFLLGMYTGGGNILMVPELYTTRTMLQGYYIGDRWHMSPRLTVSYGLRYEYFPLPTRGDRGMERYDFDNNKMLVCGFGVVPEDCGVRIGKKYFAPRAGFAYRVT